MVVSEVLAELAALHEHARRTQSAETYGFSVDYLIKTHSLSSKARAPILRLINEFAEEQYALGKEHARKLIDAIAAERPFDDNLLRNWAAERRRISNKWFGKGKAKPLLDARMERHYLPKKIRVALVELLETAGGSLYQTAHFHLSEKVRKAIEATGLHVLRSR